MYHVMEYCQTCGCTSIHPTNDPAEDGMTDTVPMCEYCYEGAQADVLAESVAYDELADDIDACQFCGVSWHLHSMGGCQ